MRANPWPRAAPPLLCALLLLLLPAAPRAARADEDDAPPPLLDLRMYQVGALTQGVQAFLPPQPPPVSPHRVSDEETPLFGAEAEEPIYPVGQVDELIELLKGSVQPVFWEVTEGADVAGSDERWLLARASPAVHVEIARWLAQTERDVLRSVRVDVRAVRTEARPPADAAALAAFLAGAAAGPSLSLVALDGQRATAFSGRELAYLADYDVSVAQDADVSDPLVGVANVGLIVDARATLGDEPGAVLLDLRAHLTELVTMRRVGTGEQRPVDAPEYAGTQVRGLVRARSGAWTTLGGSEGWTLYARATPGEAPGTTARPATLAVPAGTGRTLALRTFDVKDLCVAPVSVCRGPTHVVPSLYTPPEPPELPEPSPFWPPESLVELILQASPNGEWMDAATLEARWGRLIVRQERDVLDGIDRLLATLRRAAIRPITTTVEILDVPASLADGLGGGTDATPVVPDAQARLLAAALERGEARRLAQARLIHHGGARNTAMEGRHVQYLQDYETEIAQGAKASNPVFQNLFAGLFVDVRGELTSAGDAVHLEMRFQASAQDRAIRALETPAGPIELPDRDVFEVRSSFVAPVGRAVLYAARGDGERRQVVLVTSRVDAE